jgi:hypothetical protein
MAAPDQCCINVNKLLLIRRRPHMTPEPTFGRIEIPHPSFGRNRDTECGIVQGGPGRLWARNR